MEIAGNDKVLKTTANSTVTGATLGQAKALTQDFEQFLRQKIQAQDGQEISEEDLFASLVRERINADKGEDAVKSFDETFQAALGKVRGGSREDAAKEALKTLRDAGTITADEADSIYSYSFSAAQLDSNTDALFDGIGSTKATSALEAALLGARTKLEGFVDGKNLAVKRSLDEASYANNTGMHDTGAKGSALAAGGSAGFLYKPIAESDGNLAVLLPTELLGQVSAVDILDSSGNKIESGRFTSTGDFGDREKYSFSKPGGEFPDNLTVLVTLMSGEQVRYLIEDSASRVENEEPVSGNAGTGTASNGTSGSNGSTGTSNSSTTSGSSETEKTPEL